MEMTDLVMTCGEKKIQAFTAGWIDKDGDGLITDKDIEYEKHSYSTLKPDMDPDQFHKYGLVLDGFWKLASNDGPIGTQLTLNEVADNVFNAGEPRCVKVISPILPFYFDFADKNGDGAISSDEMRDMFGYFTTVAPDDSEKAFKGIDTDGDGKISRDEYVNAIVNFTCGGEDKPFNNLLFGPLVD